VRSERLVKLLELLHRNAAMEADALARDCGVSVRTLSRDLDALRSAGFSVYFDRGYRLAFPPLLPPVTFTANEALALRLAARKAPRGTEPGAEQALSLASEKLQQALAARPPDEPEERQLSLLLPVRDARIERLVTRLTPAIGARHTVKLKVAAGPKATRERRVDPLQLLPSAGGWTLLAYAHDRHRIVRIPLARVQDVSPTAARFRGPASHLLERHLHSGADSGAEFYKVRILCRPPLAQALRKHPPVGALMWDEAPAGAIIFTLATVRAEDQIPWLLACSDAVEILEPAHLRQEVQRIALAIADHHRAERVARDATAPELGPASMADARSTE